MPTSSELGSYADLVGRPSHCLNLDRLAVYSMASPVTLNQWRVLRVICDGKVTISEISEATGLSLDAIWATVRGLQVRDCLSVFGNGSYMLLSLKAEGVRWNRIGQPSE